MNRPLALSFPLVVAAGRAGMYIKNIFICMFSLSAQSCPPRWSVFEHSGRVALTLRS